MNEKILIIILTLVILIPLTIVINFYISLNPFFYVFIYSLTGIMMLILSLRNKRIWVPILFTYNAVDFIFVFSGFILIILNFFDSSLLVTEILKYCFSFLLLFLLPGWIFVRLLNLSDKFHKIPILVISFSISLGVYFNNLYNNIVFDN